MKIELFQGARGALLPLFCLADDSALEIRSYIEAGEVLVARCGERIMGHVQLIAGDGDWEIRSLAVLEAFQGQGAGTALVRAALDRAFGAGAGRIVVATASADIGNLRFYQRCGFRMERIERDAFTAGRGYAEVEEEGIPVRDRVWFSMRENERRQISCSINEIRYSSSKGPDL